MKKPTLIDKGTFEGLFRPESKKLDIYSVEFIKFPECSEARRTIHLVDTIACTGAANAVEDMDDFFDYISAPLRYATPEERVMTTASEDGNAPPKLCPACGTDGLSGCIDCFDAGRLGSGITHADRVGAA